MLKLENISVNYAVASNKIARVIHDVSFTVQSGEFVAIVGPSGSGKTTLLRAIAGLTETAGGNILVDNIPVTRPGKDRGVIFQHFSLFPWLTVAENISFGLDIQRIPKEIIKETVRRYLTLTGLTKYQNVFPKNLSGGMQQRVAIARTLANNLAMILLDEPFAALDVQTRSQMQEFLARLFEEEKKTMILVTHDVEEAMYLADRVFVLGTKPGYITEEVRIDLPRPRRSDIRYDETFVQLKKYLSYAIRSESIKGAAQVSQTPEQMNTLTIGTNIWPGIVPLYLAEEKHLFKKHGLEVNIASVEWTKDRLEPIKDGSVDILNTTLDTAIAAYETMSDLRIIMPFDCSLGGDAVVAHAPIRTLADLKGKKVGFEKNWISEFFLYHALHQAGLSASDVELIDIKGSNIGGALIAGTIDAGSTQEPWLSKIKDFTKARVIASSSSTQPLLYSVFVVRETVWKKKKDLIEKFKKALAESIQLYTTNVHEATKLTAPYLGLSETDLTEQLAQLIFVDPLTDLVPAMTTTLEVLLKEHIVSKRFEVREILSNI